MGKFKLYIEDIRAIKIKKIQPYAIHFDYKDKHYLLHISDDGGEDYLVLYEKRYLIDKTHKEGDYYVLSYLTGKFLRMDSLSLTEYFIVDNISMKLYREAEKQAIHFTFRHYEKEENKKHVAKGSITYKFVDKHYLAYKLMEIGFAEFSLNKLTATDVKKVRELTIQSEYSKFNNNKMINMLLEPREKISLEDYYKMLDVRKTSLKRLGMEK